MYYKGEYHIMGIDNKNNAPINSKIIEIIQPWSNDGYFIISDKIYSMEPGCVFLLNAFETHCANTPDINKFCRNKIIINYDYIVSVLDELGISENALSLIKTNPVFYFDGKDKSPYELDNLFKKATASYNGNSNIDFAEFVTTTVQMLLILLKKEKVNHPVFYDNNKPINKAMEYINNNLNIENLNLDDICENCHTNKYYLCHTFKETTGMSVMKYIKYRRINQAKKLLIETDMKICNICEMIGYSNSSLFCKIFKQETGYSPLKYRNIQ